MSYCENAPAAHDLNYCSGIAYGAGLVHVGQAFPYLTETPVVVLTNLASGRKQMVAVDEDELPFIVMEQPDDLSPGQVYLLEVMGSTEDDGMAPIAFHPHVFDQASGQWGVAEDTVDGVTIRFVKLFAPDGVHSHQQQWVSLK